MTWQDALMKLHVRGWDTDDIDGAAEDLLEACTEGDFEGTRILDLSVPDTARALGASPPEDEIRALLVVADLRAREGPEASALHRALYDLDAFAYEYAGDD